MASLNVPPPLRVAIGYVIVGGQRLEVFLTPEWTRYLDALNKQVIAASMPQPVYPPDTHDESSSDFDYIPGQPGQPGPQGDPGPVVVLFQDGEGSSSDPMPGPRGEQGPRGDPGPAIFLLQEPENHDVFWPIKNT